MISAEIVEVLFCAAKAACASGLNCACRLIELGLCVGLRVLAQLGNSGGVSFLRNKDN